MREKKINERLQELKERYDRINDFDFEAIIELEDEYDKLTKTNPEHTKRRREILDMRDRLLCRLKIKPKEIERDVYIDVYRNKDKFSVIIYYNGRAIYINGGLFSDVVDVIGKYQLLENKNIYLDKNGIGIGIAEELDKRGVKYNKLYIDKINI